MTTSSTESRYHHHLVRGTVVNALGLLAKAFDPVFVVVITWLYGPAVMGLYFVASFLGDMVAALVTGGYVDAATIFGSRHVDEDAGADGEEAGLYPVLANAFVATVVASVGVAVAAQLSMGWIIDRFYPHAPELRSALGIVAWTMVPIAISRIAVAATKARMRMEQDAIVLGLVRPLLQLSLSVGIWFFIPTLYGLMVTYAVTQMVVALVAVFAMLRHFRWRALMTSVTHFAWDGKMFRFAFPQSVNMTFNRYITRLDVVMLSAFGVASGEVAFYATGALITGMLRQIRLIYSSALAPIAARHHRDGERDVLSHLLGRVAAWTAVIVVPVALVLAIFRNDVLRFVDQSYVGDTRFVLVLLLVPLIGTTYGLAGNCLVFTGRSGWTLMNSALVGLVNTVLNVMLIPRYGLLGAAIGSAVASWILVVVQVVELWKLEDLSISWRAVYRPQIGLLLGVGVLALVWDPAALSVIPKMGLAILLLVGFFGLMRVMTKDQPSPWPKPNV